MSFWTILVFPALFTAEMSLIATTDSVLMTGAYGWAFVSPIRKVWYNLTITAVSVVVAIFIGGVEALGLICDKLGLKGGFWGFIGILNNNFAVMPRSAHKAGPFCAAHRCSVEHLRVSRRQLRRSPFGAVELSGSPNLQSFAYGFCCDLDQGHSNGPYARRAIDK